jgi:hypothetical protein
VWIAKGGRVTIRLHQRLQYRFPALLFGIYAAPQFRSRAIGRAWDRIFRRSTGEVQVRPVPCLGSRGDGRFPVTCGRAGKRVA